MLTVCCSAGWTSYFLNVGNLGWSHVNHNTTVHSQCKCCLFQTVWLINHHSTLTLCSPFSWWLLLNFLLFYSQKGNIQKKMWKWTQILNPFLFLSLFSAVLSISIGRQTMFLLVPNAWQPCIRYCTCLKEICKLWVLWKGYLGSLITEKRQMR